MCKTFVFDSMSISNATFNISKTCDYVFYNINNRKNMETFAALTSTEMALKRAFVVWTISLQTILCTLSTNAAG